jgi:hypothetical protein
MNPYPYPYPCEIPSTSCFEGVTGVKLVTFTATYEPKFDLLLAALLTIVMVATIVLGMRGTNGRR